MAQIAVVAQRLRRRARSVIAALNFMYDLGELVYRFLHFGRLVGKEDFWHAVSFITRVIEPQSIDGFPRLLLDNIGIDLKLPLQVFFRFEKV